jgi:hypothetical protein
MPTIKYAEPAELYLGRDPKRSRGLGFKRFPNAAEAIQFAMEDITPGNLRGATLEVGESRFSGLEIAALYADKNYPLARASTKV